MSGTVLLAIFATMSIVAVLTFGALVRDEPGRGFFRLTFAAVALAGAAGLVLMRLIPNESGGDGRSILILALMWFAWVGLAAVIVQALRQRFPDSEDVLQAGGALVALSPLAGWAWAVFIG